MSGGALGLIDIGAVCERHASSFVQGRDSAETLGWHGYTQMTGSLEKVEFNYFCDIWRNCLTR